MYTNLFLLIITVILAVLLYEIIEIKKLIFTHVSNPYNDMDEHELYEKAKAEMLESQKASPSFLQIKFKIGYARAARLLDLLEEDGVIGPARGAKPRQILQKK